MDAMTAKQGTRTLLVRDVPLDALEAFRTAARARGMTQGDYLAALVALHRADLDDEGRQAATRPNRARARARADHDVTRQDQPKGCKPCQPNATSGSSI